MVLEMYAGMRINRPQTCNEWRIAANPQCMSIFKVTPLLPKTIPKKWETIWALAYTLGSLRGHDLPPFSAMIQHIYCINRETNFKSAPPGPC
jgi:hypothetical protein